MIPVKCSGPSRHNYNKFNVVEQHKIDILPTFKYDWLKRKHETLTLTATQQ